MNRRIFVIVGAFMTILGSGCDTSPGGDSDVAVLLKTTDGSVLEMRYGRTRSDRSFMRRVQYGQPETQRIASALLAAKRDSGVYDTPVPLHIVHFYAGSNRVAEIGTCSDLFVFRGKQYRDESGTLSKLVDAALDSAQEMEEKTPEQVVGGAGRPAPQR